MINERQQNNFDALRLCATFFITFSHSFGLLGLINNEPLMSYSSNKAYFSFIGIVILFSISGFLIAKSISTSISLKNYFWKRFIRVQPLLFVVCLISVFIIGPIFTTDTLAIYFSNVKSFAYLRNVMPFFGMQFTLPNVFVTNSYEQGINGSLWTLVIEERLYVLIALLYLLSKKINNLFLVFAILLNSFYFINTVIYKGHLINYLNGTHFFHTILFFNAVAIYFLKINFLSIKYKLPCILLLFLIIFFTASYEFSKNIQVVVVPFLVLLLAHTKGISNKIGKYGDFSYGIYIFSFPVQQMLISKNITQNPYYLFFITCSLVVPLAVLSWYFLESKLMSFKSNII